MTLSILESGTGPNRQNPHCGPGHAASSAPVPKLLQRILPGMVARGHGIDALCHYLDLARTVLLDLLVELDLPMPHDRPLRKPGGRNPWSFADTTLFIVLWMAGWHAESLGQRFGRSAGSARYKARHLGLPRRDRKLVFRPPRPGEDLPGGILQGLRPEPTPSRHGAGQQGSAVRTTPDRSHDPDAEASLLREQQDPAGYGSYSYSFSTSLSALDAFGTVTCTTLQFPAFPHADLFGPTPVGTPPAHKPKRHQVEWTRERDQELAQRWWARQHYKAIAREMGISPSAVHSRRLRLELPSFNTLQDLAFMRPDDLVEEFDPSVVATHIAAANYYERKCNKSLSEGKVFWFWTPRRNGSIVSQEHERLRKRRESRPTARPRRSSEPNVPLLFVSDLWRDAGAEPVPHSASLPARFAPHGAILGA